MDQVACANGDYFMLLNAPDQRASAPDPVNQLRDQFNAFQASLENRPDAIQSTVGFISVPEGFELNLSLFDWRGIALGASVNSVTVDHAVDSANESRIGPVQDNGDGTYTVVLTSDGFSDGDDRFLITINDGIRLVVIPPNKATLVFPLIYADGFDS